MTLKERLLMSEAATLKATTLHEEEIAALKDLNDKHREQRKKLEEDQNKEREDLHTKYARLRQEAAAQKVAAQEEEEEEAAVGGALS